MLLYYSGHGELRTMTGFGGEEIKEGYVIPFDSTLQRYASNVSIGTIVNSCQNCSAKHVLLILDSCFSGYAVIRERTIAAKNSEEINYEYIKNLTTRRAIQVIAASGENEPIYKRRKSEYSAFTRALLDILEKETDPDNNGILTASEIGVNLQKLAALQPGMPYQMPIYSHITGSESGDFVFRIFNVKTQTASSRG